MPPLMIASFLGILAAVVTALVLNRLRLSRYFFYPPLVLFSLVVIYTIVIGSLVIGT